MARLGVSPVFKAYDTDGSVLASGTVETYITGTSTPKSTWDEAAESTENTASFTLDANGEKVIYFETDVAYKIIIKDSGGTTVRTVDPYRPIAVYSSLDQDLDVNGNSIVSSSAGDIVITPDTTGDVILDGLKWPQADGTVGQVIKTDGAAQLGWVAQGTDVVSDTTPQLGGDLDANAFDIQFDDATGIDDDAGNEQIVFQKTASAVNYLDITNAVTGTGPIIAAAGSDSNIDINIDPKGTGAVIIDGLSYPIADGTSGQAITSDGAGTLSFSTITSDASQAQMEAATATDVYGTPENLHYHPAMAKAYVVFNNAGTILDSHNVTSVADNGTGDFTITWAVTFSSVNFAVTGSVANTSDLVFIHSSNPSTTTSTVFSWDISGNAKGETGITHVAAAAFGDLT